MRALYAANYLIYLMSDTCEDLTNMKINKLLYYAQGHWLKEKGKPLFDEIIEAWRHGPILKSVYHCYSDYEDRPICYWSEDELKCVTEEEKEILKKVALKYGRYTASALRNMTHVPNSPWSQVFVEGEYNTQIPNSIIKKYFEQHIDSVEPKELNYSEEDFIGYRDEDGYLVLPKGWDDEAV